MDKNLSGGIYIHVPFCLKKCRYCDFYSIEEKRIDEYLECLKISLKKSSYKYLKIDTVYFGGGTPSLLPLDSIRDIFEILNKEFNLSDDLETSFEVNPKTLNKKYMKGLLSAGINRLNIGIQSFNDNFLNLLGRIHSAEQAREAYYEALDSGFENIGLDLIYCLPGQSLKNLEDDLKNIIELSPAHISAYILSLEPGTALYKMAEKNLVKILDEGVQADFFCYLLNFLEENNYIFYEVSNFAKSADKISRHNYKYWKGFPYLGFGPSAHSYIYPFRMAEPQSFDIWADNIKNNVKKDYFAEKLDSSMEETEFIYLRFRTAEGLNIDEYSKKFKKDFESFYFSKISVFIEKGYIKKKNRRYFLTKKGFLILDYICLEFIESI
ncbi:MAG: radical SAM protein [Deltaproteobacteria bacterium]|nr:MAG: radical SAM protein [Deltaproteobacteria bacterium]